MSNNRRRYAPPRPPAPMTLLAALWKHGGRADAGACDAMLRAQGALPGTRGAFAEGEIALGRAVLGPAAEAAHQAGPVESPSGAFILLADARLDNRTDFLAPLGLTQAAAAPLTDAGLMILCFDRWGAELIDRLIGDFALALWDRRAERLLLARDFAGMRPLHFHEGESVVAVTSMAKGLHALDLVPRAVNENRLMETLASIPHEGRETFFQAVQRVEPGEVLTFRRGGRASRVFWTPPANEIRFRSQDDYAEALIEKLDAAVDARLRDVRGAVGSQLSAGLDSSAVTTSAALRFPGRVLAFTSVPPTERLPSLPDRWFGNEGPLAAATASLYANIEHRPIATGTRLPLEDLDWELELFERSDLNLPNLAWANRINEAAAAEGIEIMLIGTMGNTTISYGGYERLDTLLATGRIATYLAECAAARRSGMDTKALLGRAAKQILPRAALQALGRFRSREHHPALAGIINPRAEGLDALLARWERNEDPLPVRAAVARAGMVRRVDPGTYYKGVLLRWNIELRDPTSDRNLAEYCLRVPLDQYFRNGTPRALIRAALAGRVPDAVRLGRRRGLQSPHWFSMLAEARGEASRLLAAIEPCEAARRLLDLDKMRLLLEQWPDASNSYGPAIYRYGLLRGLSAGEFIRLHSSPPPGD